jgi:hypothetical protein
MSKFNAKYCEECKLRDVDSGKILPTKNNLLCPAGRKNNPKSLKATLNTLENNGSICSFNPALTKYGLYALKSFIKKGRTEEI